MIIEGNTPEQTNRHKCYLNYSVTPKYFYYVVKQEQEEAEWKRHHEAIKT